VRSWQRGVSRSPTPTRRIHADHPPAVKDKNEHGTRRVAISSNLLFKLLYMSFKLLYMYIYGYIYIDIYGYICIAFRYILSWIYIWIYTWFFFVFVVVVVFVILNKHLYIFCHIWLYWAH
jgi:hypothetical protein